MSIENKLPRYERKPLKRADSKYRDTERIIKTKKKIGTLISLNLLRPRDIKALRTVLNDEPADMVPSWSSGAFSTDIDHFAEPASDLVFPENKQ